MSNDDLPTILVSAVDVATASEIIRELVSDGVEPSQTNGVGAGHGDVADEPTGPGGRGVAWRLENKYYSVDVRLLAAPDRPARPTPRADLQAHLIYLTEDEVSYYLPSPSGMDSKTMTQAMDTDHETVKESLGELLKDVLADELEKSLSLDEIETSGAQSMAVAPSSNPLGGEEEGQMVWMSAAQGKKLKRLRKQEANPTLNPTTANAGVGSGGGETTQPAPKMLRQYTDSEERRPAKCLNTGSGGPRNSARECRDLAVMIRRSDSAPLDEAAAAHIRDVLIDKMTEALEAGVEGPSTAFATSGLVAEGFFLVTPMTKEAREWLLALDIGQYQDTKLVVRKMAQRRVR